MVRHNAKRLFCLCVALALALFTPLSLHAASSVLEDDSTSENTGDPSNLRIEQVQITLPLVDVWFYPASGGSVDADGLSAALGTQALEVQDVQAPGENQQANYFFLVDCSTSTTGAQMAAVKTALRACADGMGPNEAFTLITFGVGVDVALDKATDQAAIGDAIDALAPDQAGTLFFDALARAIALAGAARDDGSRKLAFIFSDSVDYNLGGHTKDEIDDMLFFGGLPFYAVGFDTGSKAELDNFGALARASGGTISVVSPDTLPAVVAETIAATRGAYHATFSAKNNVIETSPQEFALTWEGATLRQDVPVTHWAPDTEAPTVLSHSQESAESIRVAFSEPVQGAESAESYVVKNAAGDLLGISAAAYDTATHAAVITLAAPPESAVLTLEFPGISDVSMEKNPVAGALTLDFSRLAAPGAGTVTNAADGTVAPGARSGTSGTSGTPGASAIPVSAMILVGLLLIAIIVGIAVAVGSSKKRAAAATPLPTPNGAPAPSAGAEATIPVSAADRTVALAAPSGPQVHFVDGQATLPVVQLLVSAATGENRAVDIQMNGSLFVGRSDICDVFFDDTSMSRQHFVIEESAGQFSIANLSQTGGTLLNGVPVNNPRPLQSGDIIEAGQQRIEFRVKPPQANKI